MFGSPRVSISGKSDPPRVRWCPLAWMCLMTDELTHESKQSISFSFFFFSYLFIYLFILPNINHLIKVNLDKA